MSRRRVTCKECGCRQVYKNYGCWNCGVDLSRPKPKRGHVVVSGGKRFSDSEMELAKLYLAAQAIPIKPRFRVKAGRRVV